MNEKFMRQALRQARLAEKRGEVPVGAVLVKDGRVIARGSNRMICSSDVSAHAEIVALRRASKALRNYRLPGTILYVTLEPCSMCAGALIWARVEKVVYGCSDSKAGACGSVINVAQVPQFNHRLTLEGGVLEQDCRALLQNFFKARRQEGKK